MARVDNYEQRFGGIGRLYTPEGLAKLPQRVRVAPNNAAAVKEIIRETLDK